MKPTKRKQGAKDSGDRQPVTNPHFVSTEGAKQLLMFATDEASPGLKFVDVTPRYLQGTWNAAEQKSIRIHVMQDFLRQKKNPVDVVEPPAMGGTVSSHVHRFRIAKTRPPVDNLAGSTSPQKAAACSAQSRRRRASGSSLTPMRDPENVAESEVAILPSTDQPSQYETRVVEERPSASLLGISPNLPGIMARMDPFAKFPIDGSRETHEILDYCEHVSYHSATLQKMILYVHVPEWKFLTDTTEWKSLEPNSATSVLHQRGYQVLHFPK